MACSWLEKTQHITNLNLPPPAASTTERSAEQQSRICWGPGCDLWPPARLFHVPEFVPRAASRGMARASLLPGYSSWHWPDFRRAESVRVEPDSSQVTVPRLPGCQLVARVPVPRWVQPWSPGVEDAWDFKLKTWKWRPVRGLSSPGSASELSQAVNLSCLGDRRAPRRTQQARMMVQKFTPNSYQFQVYLVRFLSKLPWKMHGLGSMYDALWGCGSDCVVCSTACPTN